MEGFDQERWRAHVGPRDPISIPIRRGEAVAQKRSVARPSVWHVIRALGALAVLAVGAIHLHEYLKLYSAIPTIGTLFVLNFVGATVIGLGLLAPLERLMGRWGSVAVVLLALGAIGLAATAFAFLTISEHTPLFGFMEPGYDPSGILASRIAEGATVVLLGTFLGARVATRAPAGRW
ncbi:MAG: hypothetical protein ACRDK1_05160 [Solirubrobacterales bacterium]